jgi:uncharacterized protein (DUF302 family)
MTDAATTSEKASGGIGSRLVWGIGGLVAGFIVCGSLMFTMMPGMMLSVHQSRFDTVEETCAALEKAVVEAGWVTPATRDMRKSMAKHGVDFAGDVRIVELCKADYAKKVLTTNPEVLTLMPCAWGVYKGADDKVYVSGMNMGLMGKMFGGTIAEVMGGAVAKDEHRMLSTVIVD